YEAEAIRAFKIAFRLNDQTYYRYKSEYDIPEIPGFVKKVIIPITYHIGNLLGKYKHFKGAPEPVRQVA
ncbi:MAG: hypothetical protein KDD63_16660, partial [Bacteroidetes bacterium]|nr:hypothetical protein [Bacteroidota bacterium]